MKLSLPASRSSSIRSLRPNLHLHGHGNSPRLISSTLNLLPSVRFSSSYFSRPFASLYQHHQQPLNPNPCLYKPCNLARFKSSNPQLRPSVRFSAHSSTPFASLGHQDPQNPEFAAKEPPADEGRVEGQSSFVPKSVVPMVLNVMDDALSLLALLAGIWWTSLAIMELQSIVPTSTLTGLATGLISFVVAAVFPASRTPTLTVLVSFTSLVIAAMPTLLAFQVFTMLNGPSPTRP